MEKSQLPQRQFHERSENNKLTDEVQFCKQQIAPVASGICDAKAEHKRVNSCKL